MIYIERELCSTVHVANMIIANMFSYAKVNTVLVTTYYPYLHIKNGNIKLTLNMSEKRELLNTVHVAIDYLVTQRYRKTRLGMVLVDR